MVRQPWYTYWLMVAGFWWAGCLNPSDMANRPPQLIVPGRQTVTFTDDASNEYLPLSFELSAVDPDGDIVVFLSPNLPPGASIDARGGLFTWKPQIDQFGEYRIIIVARDTEGQEDTQTVVINVPSPTLA